MADWRQIQARIRKAKTSSDPSAKLSELYQRTRDAMVAWELGAIEEKAGRTDETVKWYTIAAQRFRRADWKKKAEEALARLGVALPLADAAANSAASEQHVNETAEEETHFEAQPVAATPALGEIIEDETGAEIFPQQPAASESGDGAKKKRRRGRRGGRGRRRKGAAAAPSLPTQAFAEPSTPPAPVREVRASSVRTAEPERRPERSERREPQRIERVEPAVPQLPSERSAHGRAGDPALASRMAHLESMLRRLLSSPLHRVDQLEEAPAGPGVFLLSDSDQVTSYYIESCQTLRIGLGNLVRGGRSRTSSRVGRNVSEGDLKEKLAEHLGINESKVSQYMKDHCVVRWIQLDDDAPHLAHFAVGVLRTPLNID
jgi:hypothetical protein